MRKIVVNICRLVLAVTFILSGFVKAVDPLGTQYKIDDYLEAMHLGRLLPDFATLGVSVAQSAVEFCLGIFLLFAIQRRLTSRFILLIMVVMTPLTLWLALTNPISDCGCFGDALVLTNWQTFWKNIVLLGCALVVAWWPKEMFRFVSESNQWIVINYSVVFVIAISVWSLYYLPPFDFRPYHIGTNLRENWQRTMEGEDLPYADFFIESEDEDITEAVLADSSYTFLMVSPYLEQADDSRLDLLNELYEYAHEHSYGFYCLTASTAPHISHWRDITGAEYPFCQTDGTTLKTIIRSNPGIVLLHDGVIIRKWSHNDMPELDEAMALLPLEQMEIGQLPDDGVARKIATILSWFVLPLALLTLADRLWMWTKWLRRRRKNSPASTQNT
ncbi:MAG: DoxX family protein [Prevotella sp.]|nr:DoxX family protein [Prevotella sp.]